GGWFMRIIPRNVGLLGTTVLLAMAAQAATPTVVSIQNLFDFSPNISPGCLVAIYGTNFGTSSAAVSISVSGKPGYIVAVTDNEINAQIPFEVSPGTANLTVTVAGATSAPLSIT